MESSTLIVEPFDVLLRGLVAPTLRSSLRRPGNRQLNAKLLRLALRGMRLELGVMIRISVTGLSLSLSRKIGLSSLPPRSDGTAARCWLIAGGPPLLTRLLPPGGGSRQSQRSARSGASLHVAALGLLRSRRLPPSVLGRARPLHLRVWSSPLTAWL